MTRLLTNREIDKPANKFYGLTDEEKKVVEGGEKWLIVSQN